MEPMQTESSSETTDTFLHDIIDTDRFPLHRRGSEAYRETVRRIHEDLQDTGCCILRGFLLPSTVQALQREAAPLRERAHFNDIYTNPYSTSEDESLPEDHPIRTFMHRTNGFVAADYIPEQSKLKQLYESTAFKRFIAECMKEEAVYEYADPFAKLVLNFLKPGAQHPWHYDTNEFAVSTLVQACEQGGEFEYAPGIRSSETENYEGVADVLHGRDRSSVRSLQLQSGDLQFFMGRFSLHRVAPNRGPRDRITGIFAYAKEPGVIGKVGRTERLFGRVSDVHREAAAKPRRSDGLQD
jgi:hypothetical protein